MRKHWKLAAVATALVACSGGDNSVTAQDAFTVAPVATFREPWAMAFLPDGRLLVTERRGALKLHSLETRQAVAVSGVPAVEYAGQGGLGGKAIGARFLASEAGGVPEAEPPHLAVDRVGPITGAHPPLGGGHEQSADPLVGMVRGEMLKGPESIAVVGDEGHSAANGNR